MSYCTDKRTGPIAQPEPEGVTKYKNACVLYCSNVTPPKPVHKHGGPGGGGGGGSSTSTAGKKKEFDPSQSLVYQMLQEESERAKRGDVSEPVMEEQPNFRRQPPQVEDLTAHSTENRPSNHQEVE